MNPVSNPARGATSWPVPADAAGIRLDKFLAVPDRLGSRGRVIAALERGKLFVNDVEIGRAAAGLRLSAGDVVRLWMDRPRTSKRRRVRAGDVDVLYEDAALIVVDKPSGLLAVPLERRSEASSVYD